MPDEADLRWLREHPWAQGAWTRIGIAYANNRRLDEALPWLENPVRIHDYAPDMLRNLAVLTCDSRQAEAALERIAESGKVRWSGANKFNNINDLANAVVAGGHARKLLEKSRGKQWFSVGSEQSRFVMARLGIAAGDFALASDQLTKLFAGPHQQALFWWSDHVQLRLEALALNRVLNRPEPDLKAIEDDLLKHRLQDYDDLSLVWRYESGEVAWPAVLAEAEVKDRGKKPGEQYMLGVAWYFRGLQCIAERQWAEAKAAFTASVTAAKGEWNGLTAAALLAWLDGLSPPARERFPAGRAIPRAGGASEGAENF